jgi:hypothetical protein
MGLLTALAMVVAVSGAAPGETAQQPAGEPAFEQLKTLVGEWRGQRPDGRQIGVTYRLSANGTVLVETWDLGPARESITIYHLNGSQLLATHFCPQGNQPRLKMWRAAGNRFDFTFHDATGVRPGQGVQHEFWIEIGADGAITRSETYVQGDQTESETITYKRVGSN